MMRPLIGITTYPFQDWKAYRLGVDYPASIERAGGIPVILPLNQYELPKKELLSRLDGLLIPGGPDVAPLLYGEEPLKDIGATCQEHDLFEISMVKEARDLGMPILGICRGLQVINVAFGGTLWQHIPAAPGTPICHVQDLLKRGELTHTVTVTPESSLAKVLGKTSTLVNTYHHQAAKDVAPGFKACAHSKEDGIIEAIESEDGILAVQWHPENLSLCYEDHAKLFSYLVDRSKETNHR
ncbi:MAG: gamma-glutamyl-gamma-aminobutyrate hydrolase family protein [Eubacteriales bacterium]